MPRIVLELLRVPRRWLLPVFAACTAWLILQNAVLLAIVCLAWGKP